MNLARAKVLKFEDLDSSKCKWVKTQKIFYEDPEGKREYGVVDDTKERR